MIENLFGLSLGIMINVIIAVVCIKMAKDIEKHDK